jgi:hypothetical protein
MSSPEWDEIDVFFDPDDFGVEAWVTPAGGVRRPVTGLFDDPFLQIKLGTFKGTLTEPTFTGKAADLAGINRGDVLEIPGKGFFDIMTPAQGDGTGIAMLQLSAQ